MTNYSYRKKPIVIEAVQVQKALLTTPDLPEWFWTAVDKGTIDLRNQSPFTHHEPWAEIETLEGTMRAERGDWIIQGVKGEIYSCKKDIFDKDRESREPNAIDRIKIVTITTSREKFCITPGPRFMDAIMDGQILNYGKTAGEAERARIHEKLDSWMADMVKGEKWRGGAVDASGG